MATATTNINDFSSWLKEQPETITKRFNADRHPLAQWLDTRIVVRGDQWCYDSTGQPLPDWMQYICNRTFRKPYGVAISKQECLSWCAHWKADQT